jgi:hypothetical protein
MRSRLLIALVCLAAAGPFRPFMPAAQAQPAAAPPEVTAEQVRNAIDFGTKHLLGKQTADGGWADYGGIVGGGIVFPGGTTALITLALSTAGVPTDDPRMQRALQRLERYQPDTTYVVSLQTLAFCQANPRQYIARIQRNVHWLEKAQISVGPNKGSWSYKSSGAAEGDNSNSQFALLALHEAERAGATVKRETWTSAKTYWEEGQNIDGSWGYHKRSLGTGSMTCAGIASLIISSDKFRQPNAVVNGDEILCCQQTPDDDSNRVEQGLAWLGRNFRVTGNPGAPRNMWMLYYLYGVERVGRMTNHRYFYQADGTPRDWYREGAAHLVNLYETVNMGTAWRGIGPGETDPEVSTAFALLFLSKGRRPVLMAKLEHSVGDDWNQHRSDVDNLTRYVETQWKRDLTWQTADLRRATVEELLQSPVLYYAGNLNPLPADGVERQKTAQKIRDYVDRGGFLFAEGYGRGEGFDQGFRELMRLVFPEPEYRLQLVGPEHPVWRAERPVSPDHMRPLYGIEYGCRTSVIYAAPDPPARPRASLSCLWELSRPGRDMDYSRVVRDQIDAGLTIGINVLAYATNREVKSKEEMFRIAAPKPTTKRADRGTIYVAKLRHPGGCNAAPMALVNLLETAAGDELKLRTAAEARLIEVTDESLFDYHLVFIHGRGTFRFTDAERAQLKTYIERGGMLVGDSICTSQAFIDAFRREMQAIFPESKLEAIPADDPMLTPAYGGHSLATVRRRDPQRGSGPLASAIQTVPPSLEGIKFDDRWGVVFSQYDLSCALEKRQAMECRGYVPADAARIGLNLLLYSLQH